MSRLIARSWVAPLLLSIPLLTLIFIRVMNFELRKDEQMYAPPALLLGQFDLYRDIFYNHTPGSAWLFHGIMTLLNTDHVLFAARFGVFLGWVIFALALIGISYALTRSGIVACVALLLILSNDTLLNQTGMAATNNFLPLAFSYLGLGLFLIGTAENNHKPYMIVFAGLFLSLAAATKINAIAFVPPVVVAAFFLPRHLDAMSRFKFVVLPLGLGGILGAIPVFSYLIRDHDRFFAHVFSYHLGPHIA